VSDQTTVECDLDLYDSDVLAIEQVVGALNTSRTKATTVDGWRREITERFAEAGFKVSVVLRQVEAVERSDGTLAKTTNTFIHTTITIDERVDPEGEFDHQRMAHEVQSNIRGLKGQDDVRKKQVAMGGAGMTRTDSGLYLPKQ
jgi:hypothetical protein